MRYTDAIIIGAGQAGLAMSRCLSGLGIDHVVLERGQVGERWRSERWDSLRLLTPNWMSRLPGWSITTATTRTASCRARVRRTPRALRQRRARSHRRTVDSVRRLPRGYGVVTEHDVWHARLRGRRHRALRHAEGARHGAMVCRHRSGR